MLKKLRSNLWPWVYQNEIEELKAVNFDNVAKNWRLSDDIASTRFPDVGPTAAIPF